MANNLDDGEFWLPSKFLTDTDDDDTSTNTTNSVLGSTVESVTETESDDDEFLAELTRQMTRYSIHQEKEKEGFFGTASNPKLHVVAAAKMRMRTDQPHKGTGYFDSHRPPLCFPPRTHTNHYFHGFFSHQSKVSQQQLQAFQFQQLWNQEMLMKQANPPAQVISRSNIPNRPLNLSASAWPTLQHPSNPQNHHLPRSGMRAVLLPGNNTASISKRESTGTGVFLPRRINPTDEPRKNTSTKPVVLVPEKVVQALNNINAAAQSRRAQPQLDSNGKVRGQSNGVHGLRTQSGVANPEIRLPSEWTY